MFKNWILENIIIVKLQTKGNTIQRSLFLGINVLLLIT